MASGDRYAPAPVARPMVDATRSTSGARAGAEGRLLAAWMASRSASPRTGSHRAHEGRSAAPASAFGPLPPVDLLPPAGGDVRGSSAARRPEAGPSSGASHTRSAHDDFLSPTPFHPPDIVRLTRKIGRPILRVNCVIFRATGFTRAMLGRAHHDAVGYGDDR